VFNRFDRIKITTELNDLSVKSELFTKKMNPSLDMVLSEEYHSIGLRVKVNYHRNKIHIDFSSKLLAEDYTSKIYIMNIRDVYEKISSVVNINPLQFYRLSPNYCETVSDVHTENIAETIEAMYSLSKFQDKFKPSPKLYRKKNITTSFSLKKNVITRESLEYLCIYNKYNELFDANKNENLAFLQTLSEDHLESLKSYFSGVIRVESKYASKARIRVCFGLGKEYNMYDLLTSKSNVNENLLNRIYDDKQLTGIKNTAIPYNKFDKLNTLKQYDNNLEKIFEIQRQMGSKIQKSKMLKPYKELINQMAIESENEKIIAVTNLKRMIKW